MRLRYNVLAGAVSLACSISPSSFAAEVAMLEEVIVTAQKRSESVQDIPLAITALSAQMLDERGITDIASMASSVPGMFFGQAGSNTRITIRGIGTEQTTVTGDPGVAFHIDGVYQSRSSSGNALFYDLQRVEVLRGPQGTLYGRNATGGSINLISKPPVEETEGNLEVMLGDYSQQRYRGVLNTPLIENKLLMRLSGQYDSHDGYYENKTPGADDIQDADNVDLRAQLSYLVNDSLDARLIYNYATSKGAGFGRKALGPYQTSSPLVVDQLYKSATPNPNDPWKIYYNDIADRNNSREGVTLLVGWDLGSMELKSITAWQDNKVDHIRDFDYSDVDIMNESSNQDSTQYSQELHLASTGSGPIEWIVGLFWLSEKSDVEYWLFDEGAGLSNLFPTIDVGEQYPSYFGNDSTTNSDAFGAFSQASYSFSDALKLTAGLRYSKDEKDSDIFRKGFTSPVGVQFDKDGDWDDVTWKVGAEWFVLEESMLYASVSTGFKSGGFLQQPVADPYDPENITAWEIGSKNRFFDDRLQANVSAYYYDYTDMQLTTIVDLQRVTTNAGESEMKGIELELVARPTAALQLGASFAYADAEFTDYSDINPQDRAAGEQDLSGNRLPRTPEYTVNISAAYTWDFDIGSLTSSVVYYWSDDVYFSAYNVKEDFQGSYHKTDVRLAFESADGSWYMALAAKNLEDDEVASQIALASPQIGGIDTAQWQAPRTIDFTVGYRFE